MKLVRAGRRPTAGRGFVRGGRWRRSVRNKGMMSMICDAAAACRRKIAGHDELIPERRAHHRVRPSGVAILAKRKQLGFFL